jgi:hypothetical protein
VGPCSFLPAGTPKASAGFRFAEMYDRQAEAQPQNIADLSAHHACPSDRVRGESLISSAFWNSPCTGANQRGDARESTTAAQLGILFAIARGDTAAVSRVSEAPFRGVVNSVVR